jgi:hypothetical protein
MAHLLSTSFIFRPYCTISTKYSVTGHTQLFFDVLKNHRNSKGIFSSISDRQNSEIDEYLVEIVQYSAPVRLHEMRIPDDSSSYPCLTPTILRPPRPARRVPNALESPLNYCNSDQQSRSFDRLNTTSDSPMARFRVRHSLWG